MDYFLVFYLLLCRQFQTERREKSLLILSQKIVSYYELKV